MIRRLVVVAAFAGAAAGCASAPHQPIVATDAQGNAVPIDSLTVSYEVGGLRVVQRPAPSNDVVAANLYLLGGARQLTPQTAGIEVLLLDASERGTARYPGDAARRALAHTGSAIVVEPGPDWTMIGLRGLLPDLDSSWAVFADRILAPTLDSAAVAVARDKLLAVARRRREEPDELVRYLADSSAFDGDAYGLPVEGTERSLAALASAALRRYHETQMVTSRMLLVVVGNVPRATLERLVAGTLARLPRGTYQWTVPAPRPPAPHPAPIMVHRPSSTNYLYGIYRGPAQTSPDYPAYRVAMALVGSELARTVREERGLSYVAYAPIEDRAVAMGGLYASATLPTLVIALMRQAVEGVRTARIPEITMQRFVHHYVTAYYADNETNGAQADEIARATLFLGDPRATARAAAAFERVTADAVRHAAVRYLHDVQFVYVGDTLVIRRQNLGGF